MASRPLAFVACVLFGSTLEIANLVATLFIVLARKRYSMNFPRHAPCTVFEWYERYYDLSIDRNAAVVAKICALLDCVACLILFPPLWNGDGHKRRLALTILAVGWMCDLMLFCKLIRSKTRVHRVHEAFQCRRCDHQVDANRLKIDDGNPSAGPCEAFRAELNDSIFNAYHELVKRDHINLLEATSLNADRGLLCNDLYGFCNYPWDEARKAAARDAPVEGPRGGEVKAENKGAIRQMEEDRNGGDIELTALPKGKLREGHTSEWARGDLADWASILSGRTLHAEREADDDFGEIASTRSVRTV